MHRVSDPISSRARTSSPEHPEAPRQTTAGPAVVPAMRAFEGLALREGTKGPDNRRPSAGIPSFLLKDIESAANALRAFESQASAAHRPPKRTGAVAPTGTELSSLQEDINSLTKEVRGSRKELGEHARNVEEVEEQIRQIESQLEKLSQPDVSEMALPSSPVVDDNALRDRRSQLQKDGRHCDEKIKEIELRHPQAVFDAGIRAGFLNPPPGTLKSVAIQTWLSKGAERAAAGRALTLSEVENRTNEFFGLSEASVGTSRAARRGASRSSGEGAKGNLDHLLAALAGEEFAWMRDIVTKSAVISIESKYSTGPLAALARLMSTSNRVGGVLLTTHQDKKGHTFFYGLMLDPSTAKVFDEAVGRKAEEFGALLKSSESPDQLLELKQAWEIRREAQRKTIKAINTQLARSTDIPSRAAAVGTPHADKQEQLRADLDRVMTDGAKRAWDYEKALVKHTQRVSMLEEKKASLDQGRTELAEVRGAKQRRRTENAEERKRADEIRGAEMDKVWQKVQPTLAQVFSPGAMDQTISRHVELSEEALKKRLDPERTRATTYSTRSDLLSAVADVLKAAADKSKNAGPERVISHERQIGHGLRLTRTGTTEDTVSHATSFRLGEDSRIAHMYPWIPPVQLLR